jgi:tRNA pseudouridine38-40 synthase
MKYKMIIAYDGTEFLGWQAQGNGRTIQERIESVLFQITQKKISITGSGRTDSGVHAEAQVAHFVLEHSSLSLKSLNSLLPDAIRILSLEETEPDFHARFSVKEKIYCYHVTTDRVQLPNLRRFALHSTFPLDLKLMLSTLPYFLGTKNFSSFANELDPKKNPIKTLHELSLNPTETGFTLKFRGDGFLYKMVRNITGTLLDIGRGKISPHSIPEIFAAQSRPFAGKTAPPHGLFLQTVLY